MGIRVIIADDYPMIRRVVCDLLASHSDIEVVGQAKNGKEAIECCLELKPDIAVVDVNMPVLNGIEATCEIVQQRPHVKVVAASASRDLYSVIGMLAAGASAYVLKDFLREELVDAIRTTANGRTLISARLKQDIISARLKEDIIAALGCVAEPLTRKEEQILIGLAEGKRIDEIARDLHLHPNTAHEIRRIIERKITGSYLGDIAMYIIRD